MKKEDIKDMLSYVENNVEIKPYDLLKFYENTMIVEDFRDWLISHSDSTSINLIINIQELIEKIKEYFMIRDNVDILLK